MRWGHSPVSGFEAKPPAFPCILLCYNRSISWRLRKQGGNDPSAPVQPARREFSPVLLNAHRSRTFKLTSADKHTCGLGVYGGTAKNLVISVSPSPEIQNSQITGLFPHDRHVGSPRTSRPAREDPPAQRPSPPASHASQSGHVSWLDRGSTATRTSWAPGVELGDHMPGAMPATPALSRMLASRDGPPWRPVPRQAVCRAAPSATNVCEQHSTPREYHSVSSVATCHVLRGLARGGTKERQACDSGTSETPQALAGHGDRRPADASQRVAPCAAVTNRRAGLEGPPHGKATCSRRRSPSRGGVFTLAL